MVEFIIQNMVEAVVRQELLHDDSLPTDHTKCGGVEILRKFLRDQSFVGRCDLRRFETGERE
jgi:hypothetical protein